MIKWITLQWNSIEPMHYCLKSEIRNSENNILKSIDKFTLENILFVNKSINRQVHPIFYDWFTFSGDLHRYKTSWSANDHLKIPISQIQKYGCFSIRASIIYSWNSMQNLLIKNLSLKNSTTKTIKYFLTKHFIEKY